MSINCGTGVCVYRNYGVGRPEIEEIGMHEIRGGGGGGRVLEIRGLVSLSHTTGF